MKFETYKVPEGHKRAGMYSFRIDGKETEYYSSVEASIYKRINWLLNGLPKGAVVVKATKAKAVPQGSSDSPAKLEVNPFTLPTPKQRIEAFLSRGKLGRKKEQSAEKDINV